MSPLVAATMVAFATALVAAFLTTGVQFNAEQVISVDAQSYRPGPRLAGRAASQARP